MQPGAIVVWLTEPFALGTGTIIGINEIGWIEVLWQNGELGAYPAQHLELADRWERDQVDRAIAELEAA